MNQFQERMSLSSLLSRHTMMAPLESHLHVKFRCLNWGSVIILWKKDLENCDDSHTRCIFGWCLVRQAYTRYINHHLACLVISWNFIFLSYLSVTKTAVICVQYRLSRMGCLRVTLLDPCRPCFYPGDRHHNHSDGINTTAIKIWGIFGC